MHESTNQNSVFRFGLYELDSNTGEEILRLISRINRPSDGEEPTTVLMVTHERALAERYAGRIVTLADGRIERIEQR